MSTVQSAADLHATFVAVADDPALSPSDPSRVLAGCVVHVGHAEDIKSRRASCQQPAQLHAGKVHR